MVRESRVKISNMLSSCKSTSLYIQALRCMAVNVLHSPRKAFSAFATAMLTSAASAIGTLSATTDSSLGLSSVKVFVEMGTTYSPSM